MLDRLNPLARHALIVLVVVPVSLLVLLVAGDVAAQGLNADWGNDFHDGADAALKSLGGGVVALFTLYVTPLTRQYGVGSSDAGGQE
mgnify:CR=1 FL=1|jgi:hypothetical protein